MAEFCRAFHFFFGCLLGLQCQLWRLDALSAQLLGQLAVEEVGPSHHHHHQKRE